MRALPIGLATIAAVATIPSTAVAASGWKLPTITNDVSGLKITSTATHCGKAKFGLWKFRNVLEAEGQSAEVRFTVLITPDGKLHKVVGVRVSGTAPENVKTSIAQTLSSQRIRYLRARHLLENIGIRNERIDTRPFNVRRTRTC